MSRLPVLSAYEQLLHEGYLAARIGSGTFVSRDLPDDLLGGLGEPHRVAAVVRARRRRGRVATWGRSG